MLTLQNQQYMHRSHIKLYLYIIFYPHIFIIIFKVDDSYDISCPSICQRYTAGAEATHSYPQHYEQVGGQIHAPATISQGTELLVPIEYDTGWAPELV
jgi:hypothetical protein